MSDPIVAEGEALSGFPAQTPTARPKSWRIYWRRLKKRPAALVGTIIFCIFLFLAVFGPWVAPYDYQAQDAKVRLDSPTLTHPFGTDQFGRDIFSRIIVGTRNIFLLGGLDELLVLEVEHHAAHDAGDHRDVQDGDHEHDVEVGRPDGAQQDQRQQQRGER